MEAMDVDEVPPARPSKTQSPAHHPRVALRRPQPRSNRRRPLHIKPLGAVPGCGRKTLDKLAVKFPTKGALRAALEADFRIKNIGAPLARKLFRFCKDGTTAAAERRVPMWNTMTRTKISGAAAPLESKADAWLATRAAAGPSFYERYTDQDLKQKGPCSVPEDDMIDNSELVTFYLAQQDPARLDEAQEKLPNLLQPYTLKPLDQVHPRVTAGLPAPGSLQFALLHAAASLDVDVLSLHTTLDQAARAPEGGPGFPLDVTLLKLLQAAHAVIKRPIWVFRCGSPAAAGSSSSASADVKVFMQEGDDDDDPLDVTPIRIALLGGQFLALVGVDHADVVDVTVADQHATEPEHAQLPDLREDVERSLDDARAQIDKIEGALSTGGASYDLSASRRTIDSLRERLKSGKGEEAAFLGTNGVGKSTVICTLVLNSSVDAATYKQQPDNYVPEALLHRSKQAEPPNYQQLLRDPTSVNEPGIKISVCSFEGSFEEAAEAAERQYATMENSIKSFCEKGGDKPQLTNFVLPCGEGGGSTTALHTYVRYGSVVHLLVEYYTVDELKQSAFNVHPALERPCLTPHL